MWRPEAARAPGLGTAAGRPLTLGWDVGGAHLKACRMEGDRLVDVAQWICPLWQGLGQLEAALDAATTRWPALRQLAQATQRALPGLCGFVGIDLVWHPELGPVGIEVNARVSCAYVGLSGLLGRPLAGEILAAQGAVGTEGGRHPFGRASTSVSATGASTGSSLGERSDVAA